MNAPELRARADQFCVDIVNFCRFLRTTGDRDAYKIADQLHDAGTSVASNYHAACRARSRAEFISKLCTVVEEADESVLWLSTLKRTGLAEGPTVDRLYQESCELQAIFSASKKTAMRRRRRDGNDPLTKEITKSRNQLTRSGNHEITN